MHASQNRLERFEIRSPIDGSTVAMLEPSSAAMTDRAVEAAVAAQKSWAGWTPERRSEVLWAWSDLILQHFEEIAMLDTRCTGKVITDALAETRRGARHARYWAGMADKLHGNYLSDVPGRASFTRREPLGAYAVILPWNAPAHSFMARSVPPLACGNAVIVKPSELSPLSALRLTELAHQAGIPSDVLQVVVGDGQVGAQLAGHPKVRGVSFTGSPGTGRRILHAAADTFKKVTLELGGKSPIVVFPDAEMDSALRAAAMGVLVNAGQICAASSRLVVHESIAEDFLAQLCQRISRVKVGNPLEHATQVGPVVCTRQYDQVMRFIAEGVDQGARVLTGGGRPAAMDKDPGLYVAPTVIDTANQPLAITREEVFGPVLTVSRFSCEQEAIDQANDSEFGLAAYIWTQDVGRMFRMAEAIEAGVVNGNTTLVMDSGLPFGGFKHSGLGGAFGADAVEGCTQTKRVTLRTAASPLPMTWEGV